MTLVERYREDAQGFREAARHIRPHPQNPHTVDAGAVARFVDVSCAYVAQSLDDAAARITTLEGLLEAFQQDNPPLTNAALRKRIAALEAREAELVAGLKALSDAASTAVHFKYQSTNAMLELETATKKARNLLERPRHDQ